MDEIGQRLKECADACISAYEKWMVAKKEVTALENLQEAVHELRKVSARLEIEMAVSEREEMSQRPIPVPPHRAAKRREGGNDLPDFITEGGESEDGGNRSRQGGGARRMGRRPPQQQSHNESAGE